MEKRSCLNLDLDFGSGFGGWTISIARWVSTHSFWPEVNKARSRFCSPSMAKKQNNTRVTKGVM